MMALTAWFAAVLVFASFFMKTIVPLRTFAIASNLVFIVYGLLGLRDGVFDKVMPILVLHVSLLPLNIIRLLEVTRTIQSIRSMKKGEIGFDFLIPYMSKMSLPAGSVLFNKGEVADKVYVIDSGEVLLPEFNKRLAAGALFGEVAIFSDSALRSATAVCAQDCVFHCIPGERVLQLFYQDPRFALQIARRLAALA